MIPDRVLVERCRAGDEEALAEVIARFGRPLYGSVYPMLLDPAGSEDVVQEAFVRFWRTLDRFDLDRPLLPWLRKIAVNLALSRIAERRREPLPFESAPEPSSYPDVERKLMNEEEIERALQALAEMEPNRRAALTLRAFGGLGYAEIAEQMGCSVGTVMSRLFRARLELREKLETAPRVEARAS